MIICTVNHVAKVLIFSDTVQIFFLLFHVHVLVFLCFLRAEAWIERFSAVLTRVFVGCRQGGADDDCRRARSSFAVAVGDVCCQGSIMLSIQVGDIGSMIATTLKGFREYYVVSGLAVQSACSMRSKSCCGSCNKRHKVLVLYCRRVSLY